jgi:nucleotide-binding universal stress UspA family protein
MRIKRILVPTDLSEASLPALKLAAEFGKAFQAELVLVFVVEPFYTSGDILSAGAVASVVEAQNKAARTRLAREVARRHGVTKWPSHPSSKECAFDVERGSKNVDCRRSSGSSSCTGRRCFASVNPRWGQIERRTASRRRCWRRCGPIMKFATRVPSARGCSRSRRGRRSTAIGLGRELRNPRKISSRWRPRRAGVSRRGAVGARRRAARQTASGRDASLWRGSLPSRDRHRHGDHGSVGSTERLRRPDPTEKTGRT